MTQEECIQAVRSGTLVDGRHVAYRYEIRHMQHHRFRDRVTIYCDGSLLFERYCYGESAGLTGSCRASGLSEAGEPQWLTDGVPKIVVSGLPKALLYADEETLRFTGSEDVWDINEKLKRDGSYTLLKRKMGMLRGN